MDALAGWLGTMLGAVGTLLALSTVPATWAQHHRAAYVLLWVMAIACLVILTVLSLRRAPAWIRFRWMTRRAADRFDSGTVSIMPHASWPVHPTGSRSFAFETDRHTRRVIFTPSRPAGLRITKPFEANVWEGSLPFPIRSFGKTIFRVIEFMPPGFPSGFVISDQSPGIRVEGEISYSEYAPPPAEAPSKPEDPSLAETPAREETS